MKYSLPKPTPESAALGANRRRRAMMARIEKALVEIAELPQPVSALQIANRTGFCKTGVGHSLTMLSLIPWLRAENLPGHRYTITVDQAVKDLCDSYRPGATSESPVDFHKRLQRELAARRKEVEVKSHGSWVPDQIPKMGLIRILNWIDSELTAFRNGHSVNVREGAEPMPQCGQEEDRGQENQI